MTALNREMVLRGWAMRFKQPEDHRHNKKGG